VSIRRASRECESTVEVVLQIGQANGGCCDCDPNESVSVGRLKWQPRRVVTLAQRIWIRLDLRSASFGAFNVTSSTPSLNDASHCSAFTPSGSGIARKKRP
jgi:hypothetical protein